MNYPNLIEFTLWPSADGLAVTFGRLWRESPHNPCWKGLLPCEARIEVGVELVAGGGFGWRCSELDAPPLGHFADPMQAAAAMGRFITTFVQVGREVET